MKEFTGEEKQDALEIIEISGILISMSTEIVKLEKLKVDVKPLSLVLEGLTQIGKKNEQRGIDFQFKAMTKDLEK